MGVRFNTRDSENLIIVLKNNVIIAEELVNE